ncbi:succinylglutamate desuccinylase/aspartoacylase family protein [Thioflexithrix psekupsensis]|uniref:Succinylglutamate desuccinylase n=1 Tax=Thioflexithrix psekupsensis TaxID=1570016 RepID=A0A251XCR4_9GAMM|nr:succinylglutamate desuccinylase/aspartoacylase family protein [Thioflexithrix psekupsensis]OUD16165.1 succinylglutamate desuccinylase [Thioflexithrix psekupsensis]
MFTSNPIIINKKVIRPGNQAIIDIPIAHLYTHTPIELPVHVINGKRAGPRLFVSAAIHGDELNGVEIIRRLLKQTALNHLRGTLIAIPIVNVFGLLNHSRYLPDRRDLNRCFPGSETGSLAARLAHIFMTEIVEHCDYGIDLHTAAFHRDNLPQIRANLDDPKTARLAHAFGVPVLLNSNLRDGSLREAAAEKGISMLLYEAGEALRFDEVAINAGVQGILSVMRELDMLPPRRRRKNCCEPFIAHTSDWVRAPHGGILRTEIELGKWVKKGDLLGIISDPFGQEEIDVIASRNGIIIGLTRLPLVNEGDALFHIASFKDSEQVAAQVEAFQVEYESDKIKTDDPPQIMP